MSLVLTYITGPAQGLCRTPLGMESGDITDAQLTSAPPYGNCVKEHARLNYYSASQTCYGFAPASKSTACK